MVLVGERVVIVDGCGLVECIGLLCWSWILGRGLDAGGSLSWLCSVIVSLFIKMKRLRWN
jgi:hypothetical protein